MDAGIDGCRDGSREGGGSRGGQPAGCCHTGGGTARNDSASGTCPGRGYRALSGAVRAGEPPAVNPVSAGGAHKERGGRRAVREGMLRDRGHGNGAPPSMAMEHPQGQQQQRRLPLLPAAFFGGFLVRVREGDALRGK